MQTYTSTLFDTELITKESKFALVQENSYFDINNRKYLGSKNRLLDFLEKVITQNTSKNIGVFVDIFSCKQFDVDKAAKLLVNAFMAKKYTKNVLSRGEDFPRSNPYSIYGKPEQLASH